ncbi:FMN-binding negative transcriptional regulator [Salinispirillum sp. LH 10-3-1]|uniref:FMN-binding negative transcriptional regulator n=1 Tax=Salinispirillum sp. LH 10-3-1 TaxID=2952525 RepID=A0AB38YF32_9GAMM
MYIPKAMKMVDLAAQHDFIDAHGFAAVVSADLQATHQPLVLHREEGKLGTLYGHFARGNPHWENLDGQDALVIFSGPHAYISPTWYAAKPNVPTWNYAAVHVTGRVSLLNAEQTLAVVEDTVRQYEPDLLAERTVITDAYRDKLLPAIVGFRLEITQLEGKQKLGQQRSTADQRGVFAALSGSKRLDDQALAAYMAATGLGTGEV